MARRLSVLALILLPTFFLGVAVVQALAPYATPDAKECAPVTAVRGSAAIVNGSNGGNSPWAAQIFTPEDDYSIQGFKLNFYQSISTLGPSASPSTLYLVTIGADGKPTQDVSGRIATWNVEDQELPQVPFGSSTDFNFAPNANADLSWYNFECSVILNDGDTSDTRSVGYYLAATTPIPVTARTPVALVARFNGAGGTGLPYSISWIGNQDTYSRGLSFICPTGAQCVALNGTPTPTLFPTWTPRTGDFGFAVYGYQTLYGTPTPEPPPVTDDVDTAGPQGLVSPLLSLFNAERPWGYLLLLIGIVAAVSIAISAKASAPPFVYGIIYSVCTVLFAVTMLPAALAALAALTIPFVLVGTAKMSRSGEE